MSPKITRPNTSGYFALWLCEEYHLSGENCQSLNSRHCITEAITMLAEVILANMWHEISYHFDVCQATDDAHIETY